MRRAPIVIGSNGLFQQNQLGDYVANVIQRNNGSGSTAVIGNPVYEHAANDARRAFASGYSTSKVIGICISTSVANGSPMLIQTDGVVEATTTQWDTVTGGSGGLTLNAIYYLGTSVGTLTTTAPSAIGEVVAPIGKALSTTELLLEVGPTIEL